MLIVFRRLFELLACVGSLLIKLLVRDGCLMAVSRTLEIRSIAQCHDSDTTPLHINLFGVRPAVAKSHCVIVHLSLWRSQT